LRIIENLVRMEKGGERGVNIRGNRGGRRVHPLI